MIRHLLIFASFISKISSQSQEQCETFKICPSFLLTNVTGEVGDQKYKDEPRIGKDQHWDGIKPIHYDLNLNFQNITHYEGSVAIEFKVITSTNLVKINLNKLNPKVDYNKITISNCNVKHAVRPSRPFRQGCINEANFSVSEEVLTLELSQNLTANENYVIRFGSIKGRSKFFLPDERRITRLHGAEGFTTDSNRLHPEVTAITTIFQMRYARTMFPCFDHPSLKATFDLCVEYPDHVMVASNTKVTNTSTPGPNRVLDCFQTTPKMSTYLFTIAMMKNYTSETIQMPGGPKIEILAPNDKIEKFRWVLEAAVPAVQYMERITGFEYPLSKLAFIAQYPAPFWGVENFGLVTVDGYYFQTKNDLSYGILYHEIVHMWVGDIVTISHWSEICLQEGLTAYFEWKISADLRNGSFLKTARDARKKYDDGYYEAFATMKYKVTQDIANVCYGKPALFYHMATKMCGGFQVIENFIKKLVEKVPYGTASIDVYDQAMAEVCMVGPEGAKASVGPGLIKGWFLQPGPIFLKTWQDPAQPNCIKVRQLLHRREGNVTTLIRPAPLPMLILNPDGTSEHLDAYMQTEDPKEICGHTHTNSGVIIDPNGELLMRKAYTSKNYVRIAQYMEKYPQNISEEYIKTFIFDLCFAIGGNKLPIEEEINSTSEDWLKVLQSLKNNRRFIPYLLSTCVCCTMTKDEIKNSTQLTAIRCNAWVWNEVCSDLRLMAIVGRNYTIETG